MPAQPEPFCQLLHEPETLPKLGISLCPDFAPAVSIPFVRRVRAGNNKSANFARAEAKVAIYAISEVRLHGCVDCIAIHADQCLGKALDKRKDRNTGPPALTEQRIGNILTCIFTQDFRSKITEMVVMVFKLAEYDPATGLSGYLDFLTLAGRTLPSERRHRPGFIQV